MEMCLKTFDAEIARIPTIFKPLFEKHERAVRLKINKVRIFLFLHKNLYFDAKSIYFLGFDGYLLELPYPATLFRWHQ